MSKVNNNENLGVAIQRNEKGKKAKNNVLTNLISKPMKNREKRKVKRVKTYGSEFLRVLYDDGSAGWCKSRSLTMIDDILAEAERLSVAYIVLEDSTGYEFASGIQMITYDGVEMWNCYGNQKINMIYFDNPIDLDACFEIVEDVEIIAEYDNKYDD